LAWGAVCVLEVAVRVSHGCNQIFLSAMGSKGVEMRINAKLVTDGPINWPKVAPRLFDANGEVRVGDVVHFEERWIKRHIGVMAGCYGFDPSYLQGKAFNNLPISIKGASK
jgi:hypothetical protein